MDVTTYHWISFNLVIFCLLAFDLWFAYKNPNPPSIKHAIWHSIGWVTLALLFNGWIYLFYGSQPALEFLTGYLVEESLSIDNLFIFLLIFKHFKVPNEAKYFILFYGVLGAIIMRAFLIWAGIALVENYRWIFIPFGLFLIFTGIRLGYKSESDHSFEKGFIYQWLTRTFSFTVYHGKKFFVYVNDQRMATPLFAILILVEFTDLVFALDSIPAILGITTDPFIVYTSNIFAILGLRSLFFVLEGSMNAFYYLHYALAFILVFIGVKMIVNQYYHIPTLYTLLILALSIATAMIASLLYPPSDKKI